MTRGSWRRLLSPVPSPQCQVITQKLIDMPVAIDAACAFGINIAITIDSAYTIGAAVTLCSAIKTTSGSLNFYIVDCGLSDKDKERLRAIVDAEADNRITIIRFLVLPKNSLTSRLGGQWAKVDVIQVLSVERVLYLDADTLVRGDLNALWRMDLQGNSIGAARDVGFPMGHK